MKRLAIVVVLLLAGVAGLGFYRGWFSLSTENADHKPSATITLDKEKIREDEQTAKEEVEGFGHAAKERTDVQADKVKEQERRP